MNRLLVAALSLTLAACLAKARSVVMPDGRSALRIECNYSFDNCERRARKECDGRYDRVTRGDMSCKDCGMDWNAQRFARYPEGTATPEGNNVYKGVLYVRCRE